MDAFLKTCLIVCPLVFLAGFVDSVAGGGGIISLPAYLMAGLPAHLAAGTNKVVNGCGTLTATVRYFRNGSVRLRAAVAAALG
ncbi:MAG: TSUP family transporter, partial [Oscillospiraceae bacterium]|nr:TSUP family transporter [Oscillospiraceae bacterium]